MLGDPNTLGAKVQNLVPRSSCFPGFLYPWIKLFLPEFIMCPVAGRTRSVFTLLIHRKNPTHMHYLRCAPQKPTENKSVLVTSTRKTFLNVNWRSQFVTQPRWPVVLSEILLWFPPSVNCNKEWPLLHKVLCNQYSWLIPSSMRNIVAISRSKFVV
jgi:hypothetical protein